MNKIIILLTVLLSTLFFNLEAKDKSKDKDGYGFLVVVDVPVTPVKNQFKSGTCWSFATTSYIEAEVLRLTKKTVDLSEMFFVYHAYITKARSFVQLHGSSNFGPGGQAHDVLDVVKAHGFVDEADYSGLGYGTEKHVHGEIDEVLGDFLKGVIANKNGAISPVWPVAFVSILNAYLLEPPTKTSSGITTENYAKSLKFSSEDYVELTSYLHHPFYTKFRLEIPDNWSFDQNYYNLPIDDLVSVIDNGLNNGYTVCWDGDVSDPGFSHKDGVAIIPETKINNLQGTEMSRWEKLTKEDLKKNAFEFKGPVPEKVIDQKARQKNFDNYKTTDDHLMHLTGIVKDNNGTIYYKTKNSWGDSNDMGGYLNMSTSYIRLNTIAIMVHKNAIPQEIRKKLGL